MPKLTQILAFLLVISGCFCAPVMADQITQTAVIGGPGGGAQTDQCTSGDYLVGIETNAGKDLDRITALCQPYHDGQVSGDTYELSNWGGSSGGFGVNLNNTTVCPKNRVVVGITVQVSKVNLVHSFKLSCAKPDLSKPYQTSWSPTSGGEAASTGSADCGNGAAVGIAFQYGANIDALGLLCLAAAAPVDTTPPQTQPHPVMLESTNFPGMFVRHKNFRAVLTKLSSDLDFKDATFMLEPALIGRGKASVSFESTNFPGMFLRHKNFALVLEKNDGSEQFAKDASFTMWPGPNGASGFEASNFPLFFIRHKDFKLWVEKTDDSKQFHADSGFMVRSPSSPPPVDNTTANDNANTDNGDKAATATAATDTTIYDQPAGNDIAYLHAGDAVTVVSCNGDNWCQVSKPTMGWIWGDDLNR